MFDKNFLKENPVFWSRLGGEWYPPVYDAKGNPYCGHTEEEDRTFQRYHRDFAKAGVHLHSIVLANGWVGDGKIDFAATDRQLQMLFEADPEGYILPRIKLDVPLDWCRNHPEEVFIYAPGKGISAEEVAALVETSSQYGVQAWGRKGEAPEKELPYVIDSQSISSKLWLQDGQVALAALIEHLENGPYADRIAGYHLGIGHCGECMHWHMGEWIPESKKDLLNYGDYGIANLRRFYDYGIKKYGSREALGAAWQQPDITRDTVDLPLPKERYNEGSSLQSYFRGREKDVIARDFDAFLCDVMADAILHFADVAKAHTQRPVGFFYGYFLFAMNTQYEGHLRMDRVLESPNVDFLASPTAYYYRAAGSASLEMTVTQSVNREKLYMEELDVRTHVVPLEKAGVEPRDCNRTMEETRFSLWRSLCKNIVHGSGFWWMDLGRAWFDDPEILAEMAELTKAHAVLRQGKHASVADVLVVADETGMESTQCNRFFTHRFSRNPVLRTREMGVLCDMYRTADLSKIDLSQYRLVVFFTNYTLTQEQLASFAFRPDATFMFYNAVGILKNNVPSLSNVEKLTGFALSEGYDEAKNCPTLHIVGEENEWLAQKTVNGRRHVLCTEPELRSQTLRDVAREAGCHVYTDKDCILFGDAELLSVFAKGETHTVLHLKEKKCCRDIRTGKVYEGKDIPLQLAQNEFLILQYQ